jgi:Domain of unknown function (DUF4157)
MSRPPLRSPRQNQPAPSAPSPLKGINPPARPAQPPRANAAPRVNHQPQRQGPQAVQPKTANAAAFTRARSGAGVVQANLIGGTQALQARLSAQHAALHHRNAAAARGGVQQTIQRKSAGGVDAFRVSLQQRTGGQPLPSEVRSKMETAFGTDFSDVRIHVGQEASSIGALAYTWGTDIHFAPGQYNPHTIHGQKILGHELWHVVQQKSGRVSNPFGGGVAVVQDHALEAEADRMGVKAAMTAVVQRPSDK